MSNGYSDQLVLLLFSYTAVRNRRNNDKFCKKVSRSDSFKWFIHLLSGKKLLESALFLQRHIALLHYGKWKQAFIVIKSIEAEIENAWKYMLHFIAQILTMTLILLIFFLKNKRYYFLISKYSRLFSKTLKNNLLKIII